MSHQEIENLLNKYINGQLTPEEKLRVEQWLESTRNDTPVTRFNTQDESELLASIHEKIQASKKRSRVVPFRRLLQAAAILLAVSFAGYYAFVQFPTRDTERASTTTEITKVMLQDGTIVWLKPNSSLTYPEVFNDNERRVSLTGEALFEVAKDAAHPFLIQCGEVTARVLGTSFNIRMTDAQTEIAVLTGTVNVSSQQDKNGVDVLPNEKVLYTSSLQTISKVESTENEVNAVVKGTQYDMHFEQTTIHEIARRIGGKFNVQVNLEESKVNDCVITADFTDQSLETTLRKISRVLAFDYTITGSLVTIKGGSCQ